jgi:hypothetical protein
MEDVPVQSLKKLRFLPPAHRDYVNLPRDIQKRFGFALKLVQEGEEPVQSKALKGFGGRSVLELREKTTRRALTGRCTRSASVRPSTCSTLSRKRPGRASLRIGRTLI